MELSQQSGTSTPQKMDQRTDSIPALSSLLFPGWKRRLTSLRTDAWVIIGAAYALFIFAYVFPRSADSQGFRLALDWSTFMIQTFQFHIGLGLAGIAVIALFAKQFRMAIALSPVLLVALGPAATTYLPAGFNGPTNSVYAASPNELATTKTEPTLRVMSVNVLRTNQNREGVIDQIKQVDPDVAVISEYTPFWHEAVEPALLPTHPHHFFKTRLDGFGIAIYSKQPFTDEVKFVSWGKDLAPQPMVALKIGDQDVKLFGIHLLPPTRPLNYQAQRSQLNALIPMIEEIDGPVILAGDFNLHTTSPQFHAFTQIGLVDGFDTAGYGREWTWPVSPMAAFVSMRLDHVLMSHELVCHEIRRGEARGSDHYPVIAEIGLR